MREDHFIYSYSQFFGDAQLDNTFEIDDIEASIYSMNNMADLLFGEETTVGQVCAYAGALENDVVTDLPGYCCLDYPIDTKYWGEQVRLTRL